MNNYTIWADQTELYSTNDKALAETYFEHAMETAEATECPFEVWMSEPEGEMK